MSNIVLVGFMGTGKTAVAKVLARETGRSYVSTDDRVEEKERMTINKIFDEKGEEYFRKVEKEVIFEICKGDGQVIDAGGGAVLDSENIAELRRNGVVVCLWASASVIYARTKAHTHRPLLNVKDPVLRIEELLEKRRRFYERADHHVDTTDLSLDQTVEAVKDVEATDG